MADKKQFVESALRYEKPFKHLRAAPQLEQRAADALTAFEQSDTENNLPIGVESAGKYTIALMATDSRGRSLWHIQQTGIGNWGCVLLADGTWEESHLGCFPLSRPDKLPQGGWTDFEP